MGEGQNLPQEYVGVQTHAQAGGHRLQGSAEGKDTDTPETREWAHGDTGTDGKALSSKDRGGGRSAPDVPTGSAELVTNSG